MCHAGTSRPGVEVLLLLLLLNPVQSASANAVCRGSAALQNLSQPQYEVTMEGDTAMGGMTVFIQSFLNTIQPNPFPKELILNIVQNTDEMQQMEYVREGLVYEIGFLVCAAIGILYIVLMPIVGFFLACCRCCGNCGGEMYQKQTSFIHCRRRTLYWSLFITTIIILAGNVIMFQSNEKLSVSIDQSQVELDRNIGNIHTYLTAVPQQIHHVMNESYRTIQEVNRNLDAIGSQLGKEIQERLRETLDSTLLSVRVLDRDAANTSIQLNKLNSTLLQLQTNVDHLQANVTAVKNRINQTLSNSNCSGCASLSSELEKLTLDISISAPSLNEFQSAVDEVVTSNLSLKIKEVENYFDSIPQRVTNETVEVVQNIKQLLGDIKTQISQFGEDFPLSALNNASLSLDNVQTEIDKVIPEVERVENIRWGVFLGVCCVVLLVVVCNFLGLILGPLGLHSKADPTNRSCTADCGGTFFMIGAGFSFLFCWLFMMIVLLLFLLGGNLYTLVCQPWKNGQLLMLIDTPGLVSRLEIGPSLGLKENINISDIYRDCEEDKSLWTTLHLYDVINLDDLLNVSKYSERIQQQFEKANITLTPVVILSPGEKKQLQSLSRKTVDYDEVTQQLSKFYSINLNTTADTLDSVAAKQTNTAIRDELRNEARDLRKIQSDMEVTINPQLENVNSSIESLRSDVEKINGTAGEVLSNTEAAQAFLDTNTTVIIKTESRTFLDCQMSYFTVFADWAKFTITQQVGRCGPVAGAVDSAEIVICSQMVDSLNAFWFSLGWCLIFFIPSIIFSIKLAKYYRKMKYSDQYDDLIPLNHIPQTWTRGK